MEELTEGAGSPTAVAMVKGDVESDNDFDRIRKLTRLISDIAWTPPGQGREKERCAEESGGRSGRGGDILLDKARLEELLEPATA